MKTRTNNTKSLKHPVYQYLIDNIKDVETIKLEYGVEVEDTISARLQWVMDTFRKEYVYEHNIKTYGSEQNIFTQWLTGVPSEIHIDVYYSNIIKLAKEWGALSENANEKQEDKICKNWFNFISNKFFYLCKHYKVK